MSGRVSDIIKKKGPAMKKLPRISFIRNRPLDRDNVKNAQLSPQTIDTIGMLHESKNWSVEKLAETYKIRKERVLAILALRKVRVAFLEKCRTISGDQNYQLPTKMEEVMVRKLHLNRTEGVGERHRIGDLPTLPQFDVLTIEEVAAGVHEVDKEERIKEIEEEDGRIHFEKFQKALEWNLRRATGELKLYSARRPPPKPKEGWDFVFSAIGDQPLEASSGEKAFAIVKEGSHGQRRTLNEMEKEILLRANQYLKGKL